MAEFSEVMRQLNRLCSHYQNCGESGCPMFDECGNIGAHCSDPKHSYRIEKTVMEWASEHPEPVYPTWWEYLCMTNVIPNTPLGEKTFGEMIIERLMSLNIPADLAQKLGIEPKE